MSLPSRTDRLARRLGALPVTVGLVVVALLASGAVVYLSGAPRADDHRRARPVHALTPTAYKVSCAAKPSVNAAGHRVTFGAAHLFDGKRSTAWRCAGNGHGQQVTITFARPVQVTSLALVPGWARTDPTNGANRFAENGAPRTVTWSLDGRTVRQHIGKPKPTWFSTSVRPAAHARTIVLAIDRIRKGNRRAMVAISEIRVRGRTTG
ncbi:MAG: discoidin domain-containing protein [Nocardioidaceae bacterium]